MGVDTKKLREIVRGPFQSYRAEKFRLLMIEVADALDEQAAQLEAYPADWREDSSLETWFPLTAEQLKAQATEIKRLRDRLEISDRSPQWDGIACRDVTISEQDRLIDELRTKNKLMREALQKIAGESTDEDGCYYANRVNIGRARSALQGESHE